ncbi:MAG: hypothetical protein JNL60_19385, partial [Bacteroidia bacterium]|nr:hypothetical protein [Bacteroidia bacterium]
MKNLLLLILLSGLFTQVKAQSDTDKMLFLALLAAREGTIFHFKLNKKEMQSSMFKELRENDTLYYENKQILRISQVKNNKLDGKLLYYFPDGTLALEYPYEQNELI